MIWGMEFTGFIVAAVAWVIAFGWFGGWVASQCGRNGLEGMLLGVFFGPLGVVVEALLPRR